MARAPRPSASRPPRQPAPGRARTARGAAGSRPTTAGRPRVTLGAPTSVSTWRRRFSDAAANRRAQRVLIVLTILGFLAVVSGSTIAAYVSQRSEIAAVREQVREQQKRVAELHAEMTRWEDPAYVEQQARQRLKFVRPGERSYTVLDPADPERVAEIEVDMAAPAKGAPWYAAVLQSAAVADAPLPPAP